MSDDRCDNTGFINSSEIKLVNLADGGYVSKDKFDAKEGELTAANPKRSLRQVVFIKHFEI